MNCFGTIGSSVDHALEEKANKEFKNEKKQTDFSGRLEGISSIHQTKAPAQSKKRVGRPKKSPKEVQAAEKAAE